MNSDSNPHVCSPGEDTSFGGVASNKRYTREWDVRDAPSPYGCHGLFFVGPSKAVAVSPSHLLAASPLAIISQDDSTDMEEGDDNESAILQPSIVRSEKRRRLQGPPPGHFPPRPQIRSPQHQRQNSQPNTSGNDRVSSKRPTTKPAVEWWKQRPREASGQQSKRHGSGTISDSSNVYASSCCFVCRSPLESLSGPADSSGSQECQKNSLLSYFSSSLSCAASDNTNSRRKIASLTPPAVSSSMGAALVPAACAYCEHFSCPSCTCYCEACGGRYCTFCSTTDYSGPIEKIYCVDCGVGRESPGEKKNGDCDMMDI